jgi:hypothetical protein
MEGVRAVIAKWVVKKWRRYGRLPSRGAYIFGCLVVLRDAMDTTYKTSTEKRATGQQTLLSSPF